MMLRAMFTVLVLAGLMGCSHESEVDRTVLLYCNSLSRKVGQMASDHAERAKIPDEKLDAAEKETANIAHGILSLEARIAQMTRIETDIVFCEMVRDIDETRSAALEARVSRAAQDYEVSESVSARAKALADLAAVTDEIKSLPLQQERRKSTPAPGSDK